MSKKTILFIIIFTWIAVAAGVILSKQHTLRTGKSVLLETVPVDPRDFLRGDYVILRYKISNLELDKTKSFKKHYREGEDVFVKIEAKEKFWEAVAVGPKSGFAGTGIYLRGKVQHYYAYRKNIELLYGIESYFVPEGEGRVIEKNMRGNKSNVVVEVIVDSSGSALIKKVYINKGI